MSRLGFYVLCGALCSLFLLGQGAAVTPDKTNIIEVKQITEETTLAAPTTTPNPSPSPNPETTLPPTTPKPTTPKPTPPTTEPTTTLKPTPPTTKPTTPKPTPPPPTPKPTPPGPLPPPSVGNFTYKENNVTCIVMQFAAQLNVTYTKNTVENSTVLAYVALNMPENATVANGSCSEANGSEQWLSLSWAVEGQNTSNLMTLVFHKNGSNYVLQHLNITLPVELFPNASSLKPAELSYGVAWQTPLSTSYRCGPATTLNLTTSETETATAATLTISHLQEEAFRTSAGIAFSAARDCGSGDVPDAVPIAVGCALGGLVIVVLIAYLVGRRRSAARGYLSM